MITNEEILRLAELANLTPEDVTAASLREDLESLVTFAGKIVGVQAEITESRAEPAALRPDLSVPSADRESVLQNAAVTESGFFVVNSGGSHVHNP